MTYLPKVTIFGVHKVRISRCKLLSCNLYSVVSFLQLSFDNEEIILYVVFSKKYRSMVPVTNLRFLEKMCLKEKNFFNIETTEV